MGTQELDASRVEEVVKRFGVVMENMIPGALYDVDTLPYPKDEILSACLFAIDSDIEPYMRDMVETALIVSLPQFQEGIGPEPITLTPTDLPSLLEEQKAGKISMEELAAKIADTADDTHAARVKELDTRAKAETQEYLELIKKARAGEES